MVVELVDLAVLQSGKVVLVNELGTGAQGRLEEVMVLVVGALGELVNPLLVYQLGGVDAHESKNLAFYNWVSVFTKNNFFFHSALFFVSHHLYAGLACVQLDE